MGAKLKAIPDFTIVIDSREQLPYFVSAEPSARAMWRRPIPSGVTFVTRKLEWGDYAVEGLEALFAIERKTLGDFLGSVQAGHERLRAEVQRATGRFVILVETDSFITLRQGNKYAKVHPNVAEGVIISWAAKYGVIPIFGGNRAKAEERAWELLRKFYEAHLLST